MSRTRLDRLMDARRVELRMQWQEIAREAGLSLAGLGAIRRGERNPSAITKAKLEDALLWAPGSIDSILAGGEPVPVERADSNEPARPPREQRLAELRRYLARRYGDDYMDALDAYIDMRLEEERASRRRRRRSRGTG